MEAKFPDCKCEEYSVGERSPGRIEDDEVLYRMFTDPIDVDDGRLAREAFSTTYTDGLSIIRDCADDADIESLVSDILSIKPGRERRRILAIFRFVCRTIRHEMTVFRNNSMRSFCVYDQTVPRVLRISEAPVPTHGIILSRRLYELPKTKNQFEADCNVALHKLIAIEPIPVQEFRGGLITRLNARSLAGEFVRPSIVDTQP